MAQNGPKQQQKQIQHNNQQMRDHQRLKSNGEKSIIQVLDHQLEQLADELTRRKMMSAASASNSVPGPQHGWNGLNGGSGGLNGTISTSGTKGGTSSPARKISPPNYTMKNAADETDPGQLLNEWLGELDNLQKGLHPMAAPCSPGTFANGGPASASALKSIQNSQKSNCVSLASSTTGSRESSATPVHMMHRRMSTPRVESPRLDSYRYSLINLEETLENDLDAILGELCALESHFPTSSSTSTASSTTSSTGTVLHRAATPSSVNSSTLNTDPNQNDTASSTGEAGSNCLPTPVPPPPPPLMMSSQENIQKYLMSSEPQYITAESVRQNKLMMSNVVNKHEVQKPTLHSQQQQQKRTESPDNDSAFCDNTSSNSGSDSSQDKNKVKNQLNLKLLQNGNQHEAAMNMSSNMKIGNGSVNGGGSDTSSISSILKSSSDPVAQAKAEKIKLAIEKIKEASIKKIFIKVFGEDGSAKSLLVDERMTVAQVCLMLAEKNYVKRDTQWGLVELLPDLHMERAYEDHELLVENLLMWKADSKNTLWFIKRPEVFDLFSRPEMYLLGETSSQIGLEMDDRARAELVEEYFSSSGVGAPEVEGTLWLKAESKKSWKKFHFVLRTSGLYYAPKGKKTSKDLVCLARFDVNQVYYGVKWQPKFKSPTRHCFAIKHPQIQAKNPKYIRYLCADTEQELNKWVTGIRVAKYGKQLFTNYRGIVEEMAHDDLDQLASSRFSADPITLAVAAAQQNAHGKLNGSLSNGPKVSTPDSNMENKSFDSALPDMVGQTSGPSSVTSTMSGLSSNPSNTVSVSAMVHATMPRNYHMMQPHPQRSNSTGSLSEKSQASTGVDIGFMCDSPEGGTIRKKPKEFSHNTNTASSTLTSESKPKPAKGVRFKESFVSIPLEDDLPLPPPPSLPYEALDFSNRNSLRATNAKSASFDLEAELECLPHVQTSNKLTRRYSDESLVSNPAMLHCGVLISTQQDYQAGMHAGGSSNSSSPIKSPEPNRPAPVLKPQIGRKPSLDKSMLAKKPDGHVSRQLQGMKQPQQRSPSYEDTLRKCQSLTRHSSSPTPSPATPIVAGSPVFRQTSCPVNNKPAVAPKPASPAVPPKPVRLDSKTRIAHLPPSGVVSRSPSANGKKPLVSQAFLNDLHQAMNQKKSAPQNNNKFPTSETDSYSQQAATKDRPFPNRFSSGEYENVQNQQQLATPGGGNKKPPPPPLPKRNGETHQQTWDRN